MIVRFITSLALATALTAHVDCSAGRFLWGKTIENTQNQANETKKVGSVICNSFTNHFISKCLQHSKDIIIDGIFENKINEGIDELFQNITVEITDKRKTDFEQNTNLQICAWIAASINKINNQLEKLAKEIIKGKEQPFNDENKEQLFSLLDRVSQKIAESITNRLASDKDTIEGRKKAINAKTIVQVKDSLEEFITQKNQKTPQKQEKIEEVKEVEIEHNNSNVLPIIENNEDFIENDDFIIINTGALDSSDREKEEILTMSKEDKPKNDLVAKKKEKQTGSLKWAGRGIFLATLYYLSKYVDTPVLSPNNKAVFLYSNNTQTEQCNAFEQSANQKYNDYLKQVPVRINTPSDEIATKKNADYINNANQFALHHLGTLAPAHNYFAVEQIEHKLLENKQALVPYISDATSQQCTDDDNHDNKALVLYSNNKPNEQCNALEQSANQKYNDYLKQVAVRINTPWDKIATKKAEDTTNEKDAVTQDPIEDAIQLAKNRKLFVEYEKGPKVLTIKTNDINEAKNFVADIEAIYDVKIKAENYNNNALGFGLNWLLPNQHAIFFE